MAKIQSKKMSDKKLSTGKRIIAELNELADTLKSGAPLESRYTVRTVSLELTPKQFDARAIQRIRANLGVSQSIFAKLMGVSMDLVSSWEQGIRKPSGPASRLLEMMESDRDRWMRVLEKSVKTEKIGA